MEACGQVVWYVGSSNSIIVDGLRNTATDEYVNDGTLSVTAVDKTGTQITGETWPVTGSYVTGTNGRYVATVSSAADMTAGQTVTAQITVTGSGLTRYWELPIKVFAST